MLRSLYVRCFAVLGVMVLSSATRGDSAGVKKIAAPTPVTSLISALSNPDPSVRSAAMHGLIDEGTPARPALCRAMNTAAPEAAARIAFVLMHTQWAAADDSDAVKQMLAGYGEGSADYRQGLIAEQLAFVQPPATSALLRIVEHDTCPAVRWEAASALSRYLDDETDPTSRLILAELHDHADAVDVYPQPARNGALLALAGWVYRETDSARAQAMMDQALAAESEDASAYAGQMDFVFSWLTDRAETAGQYAREAELLRAQANRWPWVPQGVAEPVADLFALHAEHGPFPGFADDVRNYRGYFANAEMTYSLGRWCDRKHHPLLAGVMNGIALIEGGASSQSHYTTAVFLVEHNWNTVAERELDVCLNLPGGRAFGVYYQLSHLATERDDDYAAAANLEAGLKKLPPEEIQLSTSKDGKTEPWTPDDGWVQVQWHYLRAARSAHDTTAAKLHLDKLLELDQRVHALRKDPGMAADIVPELQDLGRKTEADHIFVDAYNALAAQVAAAPSEPMPKNNLAWLCACSGRHLDEAIRTANQALALVPEDPECLDTLAEAYFRSGNVSKALEIETHAASLKPDDVYMQKQVRKYQAAVGNDSTHAIHRKG
jgi:tetratricopeptide (TPR) repeat protein